jgi:hypothetical protein
MAVDILTSRRVLRRDVLPLCPLPAALIPQLLVLVAPLAFGAGGVL